MSRFEPWMVSDRRFYCLENGRWWDMGTAEYPGGPNVAYMGAWYPNSSPQAATAAGASSTAPAEKKCEKCVELSEKLARYEAVIDAAIAGAIPPVVRGMAAKAKHPEQE